MKRCKFCYWHYDVRVETDKKRLAANERGFCSPACGDAWDTEKRYTLERYRRDE